MASIRKLTVFGAVVALGAAACGAGADTTGSSGDEALEVDGATIASAEVYGAALEEGSVDVYTAIPGGTDELWEAFTEDTGIEVNGLVAPTGKLTQRIESEFAADKLPADVIAMPDRTVWEGFVANDLLEVHELPEDVQTNIVDEYLAEPGTPYQALSLAANTPAFNSELVDEESLPNSWQDLLDSQFKDDIGLKPAPAGSGGYVLALFEREVLGADYWTKMAGQEPILESSASAVAESLARGEFGMAVNRPPTINELKSRGAPVELLWLEEGTPMAVYFIGKVRESSGSTHPNAAEVYINWSLAKAGQDSLAGAVGDYAVNSAAATPSIHGTELPPLEDIKPWVATPEQWLGLRDEYTAEWSEIFDYRG